MYNPKIHASFLIFQIFFWGQTSSTFVGPRRECDHKRWSPSCCKSCSGQLRWYLPKETVKIEASYCWWFRNPIIYSGFSTIQSVVFSRRISKPSTVFKIPQSEANVWKRVCDSLSIMGKKQQKHIPQGAQWQGVSHTPIGEWPWVPIPWKPHAQVECLIDQVKRYEKVDGVRFCFFLVSAVPLSGKLREVFVHPWDYRDFKRKKSIFFWVASHKLTLSWTFITLIVSAGLFIIDHASIVSPFSRRDDCSLLY